MPFIEKDGIRYYYFERLQSAGLIHGIFTRHGGVSPATWGSLNAGSRVWDTRASVAENIRRAVESLGRKSVSLAAVRQVHGSDVRVVTGGLGGAGLLQRADPERIPAQDPLSESDAMVSSDPEVTLFMRFADCVPILFFDPVRRAAGMAHAGWRGTVRKVAANTVRRMVAAFGSRPRDILAGIGPAICAEHYEVGAEVVEAFEESFAGLGLGALLKESNRPRLDLSGANRLLLQAEGLRDIEVSAECTAESRGQWYSHRAEGGKTGRFMALAGIDSDG